jgi:hypothetical protein
MTEKKQYPVIELPADGKPEWCKGAWCMVFVYSKYKGNFVVKGYHREVFKYLKENHTHYFYYLSMWSKCNSRGFWSFWKDNVSIFSPDKSSKRFKRYKFQVVKYLKGTHDRIFEKEFKRLPKRWIPEFDKL